MGTRGSEMKGWDRYYISGEPISNLAQECRVLTQLRTNAVRYRTCTHLLINYRDRIARNLESAKHAPWVSPSLDRKYGWRCMERGVLKAWKWQREAARSKRLYGALGKAATSTCEAVMEGLHGRRLR